MIKLEEYRETINKCSQCSYCQATCPVYMADLMESYVARNRISVINAGLMKEEIPVTARVKEIIERCLLCTNCVQTCPGQVPIDEIVIAARYELGKKQGGIDSVKNFVMSKMLTQRGLTGIMGKAGAIAQKMGIATREMPALAGKSFDKMYSGTIVPEGEVRARIAYFVGCGTNFLYPDTGAATVEVLKRNGVEVIIPEGQVCCGIPTIAEGDLRSAREMVRTNVKIFADMDVDAIITDCTSCGMMFKEKFPKVLSDDDPLQEKAQMVSGKIREVTDYLNNLGLIEKPAELNTTYAYHVPCHRGWSPTVKNAPRELLADIPGAQLDELENPEHCCGAAGTFFMEHRDLSEKIRSKRLEDFKDNNADIIITQCPVCRFYLTAGQKDKEVIHPVGLLAKSYGIR